MHGVRKKIRIPRKIAILCALALLIAAAAGILLHVMQRSKQQTIYTASYLKSITALQKYIIQNLRIRLITMSLIKQLSRLGSILKS